MRNITESELLSVYGGAGDEEGEIVVTANKKFDYSIYQNSDGSFIGAAFVGPSSLLSGGGGGGSGSASDSDEGDPDGDDDGDGIPNHEEEIVVEGLTSAETRALGERAEYAVYLMGILTAIGTGGLALEAGVVARLTVLFGEKVAGAIVGGASAAAGGQASNAFEDAIWDAMIEDAQKDKADDGIINRSHLFTPEAMNEVQGLIDQWNNLNTPPPPTPGLGDD